MDIPRSRNMNTGSIRDGYVAGGTRSGKPTTMLPTPPNSISPTLPPHALKHKQSVDSDIDLHDTADQSKYDDTRAPGRVVGNGDGSGAITPDLLAKHHLPAILLAHGPLAIRHIIGYLTSSLPGFASIPPAKARRLVVSALEGRGVDGEGGGTDGNVVFEKVGWGRWDAHYRGQPARDRRAYHQDHPPTASPPSSVPNSYHHNGLQIPHPQRREGAPRGMYGTSTADSAVFSHSDFDYGEEVDRMSLDGDGDTHSYCSSMSDGADEVIPDDQWSDQDATDEEDWAQIGADALRARSLNGGGLIGPNNNNHNNGYHHRAGGPASTTLAKTAPPPPPQQQSSNYSFPDYVGDVEERAAVEALLRLGSM